MKADERLLIHQMAAKSVIAADNALKQARILASQIGLNTQNLQNIYWADGRGRIHRVILEDKN